ncbi:auxin-responsive protein SAUR22-like [Ipomoea triloba]|uniref:auxin-responsive protein SAUR22-like n=1 Tax=Ipomoea triloba TaxID=35885 RepID=UPI00125E6B4D|nr:auxin-responsive protein SAUR22-like [Ipomoea triloba]
MAKLSSRANGKRKSGMNLKVVVEKLQKSFVLGKSKRSVANHVDEFEDSKDVTNDVKAAHFAVMVVDDDERRLKRFIVPLSCLRHPCFLRLLEKAAEEYGFEHEGALMLLCSPTELENIIAKQKQCNGKPDWNSPTSQEL